MFKLGIIIFTLVCWATLTADVGINVKRYPVELQETYSLVETQCTTCHGLNETTRSPEVLPSYWEKTVQSMLVKKDSGMTPDSAQKITDFLIYDSYKRRSLQWKKDFKALPEEQQKIEQSKMDAILNKYPS